MLAYMAVRAGIYRTLPDYSAADWFARDAWMTIPRLVGFVALLVMNRLLWKRFAFDIDLQRYGRAALYGVPLIGLYLGAFAENCGRYWPRSAVIVAIFTTPVVGLFEEYAWRGVILETLLATRSRLSATALSSLLFTVYHVEARPLSSSRPITSPRLSSFRPTWSRSRSLLRARRTTRCSWAVSLSSPLSPIPGPPRHPEPETAHSA